MFVIEENAVQMAQFLICAILKMSHKLCQYNTVWAKLLTSNYAHASPATPTLQIERVAESANSSYLDHGVFRGSVCARTAQFSATETRS